jgi:hypothetical protein
MYAILFGLVDPLSQENPAKDRTAAIVGATFLEYALKQAIIRYFKRDNIDRGIDYLFDLDQAPYRGFAGLTRLARALGIIDQSVPIRLTHTPTRASVGHHGGHGHPPARRSGFSPVAP